MTALLLTANSASYSGQLPIVDITGSTKYAANNIYSSMPATVSTGFTTNDAAAGISVGSGSTVATGGDYQLESTITSDIAGVVLSTASSIDSNGYPFIQFDIMISNTGSTDFEIREIGYKQAIRCAGASGSTSLENCVCLIDRTVLQNGITIEHQNYAFIRYTLKTMIPSGS